VTYGTTEAFLNHFGLDSMRELPGLAELKGAGLLDSNLPPDFKVPEPTDIAALLPDELPLDVADDEQEAEPSLDLPGVDETDRPEGQSG
jgi:segregation and condensation protein B